MDPNVYSLPEAARLAGVSEDELRCAVKDGLLRARFYQNTWEYLILQEDLAAYLQRSRRGPTEVPGPEPRRVMIIDDEINWGNLMKIELERDPRVRAKFATWGKDGVLVAKRFEPHLCLVDYLLPDQTGGDVVAQLREERALRKTKMVVYSAHTQDVILHNPVFQARLRDLGTDEFLSKALGMRPIIVRVYQLLGLDTQTRILRKIH